MDAPVNKIENKWRLVNAFVETKGIIAHHLSSFNQFIDEEIVNIVKANSTVYSKAQPNWYLKFLDVRVNRPQLDDDYGVEKEMYPQEARLRGLTYAADIVADIEYTKGQGKTFMKVLRKNVPIGKLPIMLRSERCNLHKKTFSELAKRGECYYDPGGYFIVSGTEKTILMHEEPVANRMIVVKAPEGLECQVISSSLSVIGKHDKYYVRHKMFTKDVPVAILFKAFGFDQDRQIQCAVGMDGDSTRLFAEALTDCYTSAKGNVVVRNQKEALRYLGGRLAPSFMRGDKTDEEKGLEAIRRLLSHIPAENDNFQGRAIYLGMMIRRIIKAQVDPSYVDDRDYIGNKRIQVAGALVAIVFEDLFKRMCSELEALAEKNLSKQKAGQFDVSQFITTTTITQGLAYAIGTGNWTVKRFGTARKGVTQVLSRFSYISMLGMLTRVNSQFEKTKKVGGRSLVGSQWGLFCPSDTPVGEECGLVKNLALLAHITTPAPGEDYRALVRALGGEEISMASLERLSELYLVLVNGVVIATTEKPMALTRAIRGRRRKGLGSSFVSVYLENRHRCVYVSTEGGRLCRPYIIVEKGQPKVTTEDIEALTSGIVKFKDFITSGKVEYLDVNEENMSVVALRESDVTKAHTHMEIEPYTILGVVAGLIPFPHHNESSRNTYQCAIGKQAMGVIGLNQRMRIDSLQYNIVYGMKPIVTTRTIDLVNFEHLPAGQNAIVAVMSNSYDIEDAIVMNQASVDRGYGRCVIYKNEVVGMKFYEKGLSDRIDGPMINQTTSNAVLGNDGIVEPGSRIRFGNVLVNKKVPSTTCLDISQLQLAEYRDSPVVYLDKFESFAEKVLITSNRQTRMLVKISLRQTRRPEIGDKFSSRHGQKGVTGIIVPQEDLPFSCYGVVPDMIMNPHGFPSRMKVGQLLEMLAGKAGLLDGQQHDGTCFGGSKVVDISEDLIRHGYNYLGKEVMTCGLTGEPLTGYIYFGPVYYQKLKQMVQDKIHARSSAYVPPLSRQLIDERPDLKVGEMERDCLIAYGSTNLLKERLMVSSDAFKVFICSKCGFFSYREICWSCKSSAFVTVTTMPYACKLLLQELQSMNITPRMKIGGDMSSVAK